MIILIILFLIVIISSISLSIYHILNSKKSPGPSPGPSPQPPPGPIVSCPSTSKTGCDTYGGLHYPEQCKNIFCNDDLAEKSCENVLFGNNIFKTNSDTYPSNFSYDKNSLKVITCPALLTKKSGMSGSGKKSPYDIPGVTKTPGVNPIPASNIQEGVTHYFDCCKPSCAWKGTMDQYLEANNDTFPNFKIQIDKTGKTYPNNIEKSSCDINGTMYCGNNLYPFIKDDTLYGFVATDPQLLIDTHFPIDGSDPPVNDCGTCYSFDIKNPVNKNIDKGIVQVVNKSGYNELSSGGAGFDLLVPGGGFGKYNGCKDYPDWVNLEKNCPTPPPPPPCKKIPVSTKKCDCSWANKQTCNNNKDTTPCNEICCKDC